MSLRRALVDVRPLRTSADFRRLWISTSASMFGQQVAVVAVLAQAWALTGSSFAVGAVGLAQAVGMVVCGLVGGTLADAVDRRRLVLWTTVGQTVAAASLAAQAFAELRSFVLLLVLVGVQGALAGLGAPARRTLAVNLLPSGQLGAGLALSSLSFQVALLVGPALGGVVTAAWDPAGAYALDASFLLVAACGLGGLPSIRPEGGDRPGLRSIAAGLRFVVVNPVLGGSFLTDVLATVVAMPVALFPAIAAQRFDGDPRLIGWFLSAIAVGGLLAGLASGVFARARRLGAVQLAGSLGWGVALTGFGLAGFGLAEPLWVALGCLAVAGACDVMAVVSRGATTQLATPDSYRGRVSSVEFVLGAAGPDVGNFRAGSVAGMTSAPFAAVSGGLLCVVGLCVLTLTDRPLRTFERP
ncbi:MULTISPECIES: MFS transporter [Prauserella salsuginis group]|uniref:MFS transporter n=1 Tax=Prauserella salsuginis TaxID=387889 RepID=A0ABW6FYK0_9PSEU|nr:MULTISPECIES: MFS transporter [Prauserella salsuginis group]MCR3720449.1 putative arabinose efflux permease, MFS family [Prauserella flava]MCR3733841.1 putative arabinose efflux permease, MFS family [Prauserella salsuginis]